MQNTPGNSRTGCLGVEDKLLSLVSCITVQNASCILVTS